MDHMLSALTVGLLALSPTVASAQQFPAAIECRPAPAEHRMCIGMSCTQGPNWSHLTFKFGSHKGTLDGVSFKAKQLSSDGVRRTEFFKDNGCPYTLTFNNREGKLKLLAMWSSCEAKLKGAPAAIASPEGARAEVFWGYTHTSCSALRRGKP